MVNNSSKSIRRALQATLAASSLMLATANAGALRAGVAKIDITPHDLTNLNPFGGGSFTAVHDPIFARALVVSDGSATAAIEIGRASCRERV